MKKLHHATSIGDGWLHAFSASLFQMGIFFRWVANPPPLYLLTEQRCEKFTRYLSASKSAAHLSSNLSTMNIIFTTIVLFCTSSNHLWSPCRQAPLRQSSPPSSLFSVGGNGKAGKTQGSVTAGKAGKGQSQTQSNGKAGKSQGQGNVDAGKAGKGQDNDNPGKTGKGQGDAGGWPSTSGNPSGSGRSNAASKSNKATATLWEQVRLLEMKSPQQEESLKTIQRLEQEKNALIKEKTALETEKNVLNKEKKDLQKRMATLQKKLNKRPDVPILFHGQYNFGRDNVVDLSRLISMYLENKPNNIDSDRIYDCVCACRNALDIGYYDNPDYFYEDMRMLTATCLASTWFSEDQRSNIERWYRRMFRDYRII